jgi:hypothetical protein
MKMTSKVLAAIVLILIFGGIMLSDRLGMWQTVSSKQVAVISVGILRVCPIQPIYAVLIH